MPEVFTPTIRSFVSEKRRMYAFLDVIINEEHLSKKFFNDKNIKVDYRLVLTDKNFIFSEYRVTLAFARIKGSCFDIREVIDDLSKYLSGTNKFEQYVKAHNFPFYQVIMEGCD